jgi:cell division protein FtsI/penicillin-binding protein 2
MDAGVIGRESTFHNPGCVQIDDAKICNVERRVDGQQMSMTQVLQYSLNTGAVWVLERMGGGQINLQARQTFYKYTTENFRLKGLTGVEIAGESNSVIYPPDDPGGARVRYANMTFGQGEQLTMIQVTAAFCAAINGGDYYQPTVLLGTTDSSGKTLKENQPKLVQQNSLRPEVSDNLKEMLQQARYLGASGKIKDNGFYVGGKSGTAQKIDPATGKYSDTLTTGTYIGFGADKTTTPKYAIMVRVDDARVGGFAGSAAAQPIFDALSNFMIQYEGISK